MGLEPAAGQVERLGCGEIRLQIDMPPLRSFHKLTQVAAWQEFAYVLTQRRRVAKKTNINLNNFVL